jgi:Tfp pilus assembly protein PilV
MNPTRIERTRRCESGLTLLEVLAAAMIFAMVMTVLISTSSTAVHNVGVSARRLEANLVAEEILANLEIQMKQGIAPEVDENELTRDPYAITILRTDLFQGSENAASGGAGIDVASMLGAELPEVAKHLKQYDIEVSWVEQNGPQRITRTTFAFDWQTAAIEFSELFARSSAGGNSPGRNGDGGQSAQGGSQSGSTVGDGDQPVGRGRNGGNGHNARLRALSRQQDQN